MTGYEYQQLAMRTAPKGMYPDDLALNAALGLAGEAGEFADIVKKYQFQGHQIDTTHLAKELGDILWYVAMGCESLNMSMDAVMEANIEKLKMRYPDGFDPERSQHRAEGDI